MAMFVDPVLEESVPFGITAIIYQEILQGAAEQKGFGELAAYFGTQRLYPPEDRVESCWEAAQIYLCCRGAGDDRPA